MDSKSSNERLRSVLRNAGCPHWSGPMTDSDDGKVGFCVDGGHCTCEFGPALRDPPTPSVTATHWISYYRAVLKRIADGYVPAASLATTALDWEIHAPECASHLTKIENCTCNPTPPGVEPETTQR